MTMALPSPADGARSAWSASAPLLLGALTLVVLVCGFGAWAWLGQISGAVIASGQIMVEQNRQVVQHPEGGVVERLHVDEGDIVADGATLMELDPTLMRTQLTAAESQLIELRARRARLVAERDSAESVTFPSELLDLAATDPEAAEVLDGQARLFAARRETIRSSITQLNDRRNQIERQIDGIEAQSVAIERQVDLIGRELADQQQLLDRGLAQASRVLALEREQARLEGQIGELLASSAGAAVRITEIENQILGLTVQRVEEAITELRDIKFREVEYVEQVTSLREQLDRAAIRAPVGGIVYGLTVFGPQAVVRPAEPLLYIVPQDRPLIITAQIAPTDRDQVNIGQEVLLRLPTFDSRTTPEVYGTVLRISADAFTDEATQASYFSADIQLSPGEIDRLPEDVILTPGLPVEAYLRTDDRSPLTYLTKPLTDYFTRAFRES